MFLSPRNGVAVSAVRSNPLQNHLSARRCGTLPSARQESDELEEPKLHPPACCVCLGSPPEFHFMRRCAAAAGPVCGWATRVSL